MTLTGNSTLADLDFDAPPPSPLILLEKWLDVAEKLEVNESKGFVLSTVSSEGKPSSRVVLLKGCDEKGVIFSTSQNSRKGRDLERNPYAAGTLWWRETIQQVNFSGFVEKLSKEISDKLFQERTRQAQAVAAISSQSAPLTDAQELRNKIEKLIKSNSTIDRPAEWHAYHLAIESIEFWQGNPDRFHKRLRYDLARNGLDSPNTSWRFHALQP